jgi:hypothetical protein
LPTQSVAGSFHHQARNGSSPRKLSRRFERRASLGPATQSRRTWFLHTSSQCSCFESVLHFLVPSGCRSTREVTTT